MAVRVEVKPELYAWAKERSGLGQDELASKFPKLDQWQAGDSTPTLKQLESFAAATRTPIGYLFLPDPPEERLPIPDFRTVRDEPVARPSPDLLDTIHLSQQRQEWFRGYAVSNRLEAVSWVSSCTLETPPSEVASRMRDALDFDVDERGSRWSEAFRVLSDNAEEAGLLVMVNGIVGSNTRRKLDPDEFRGFALVDPLAPTVFVNGSDTRAAQIFTLAHEIAHIWLGETGLDNADLERTAVSEIEKWCNRVAAEFLVAAGDLRDDHSSAAPLSEEINRLARKYKVSTLVVLRRLYEENHLTTEEFQPAFRDELGRVLGLIAEQGSGGGNFYNTQPVRVSKTFARAVISDALTGRTTYSDAFRMLGLRKSSTFNQLAQRLGVA